MEDHPSSNLLLVPPAETPANSAPTHNPYSFAGWSMIVLAAILLLCGLCSCLLYVVAPLSTRVNTPNTTQTNVVFGSLAALGILFAALFIWQGILAVRGRSTRSAARVFPPVWILLVLFLLVVGLGTLALSIPTVAPYLFPPWHLLAAMIPPLALLAYGARRLGAGSGMRALVASFSWGAFAGTSLAFVLEMVVLVVFILIATFILMLSPNSQALIQQLQQQLLLAQRTQNYAIVEQWLSNPALIAAMLLYLSVAIPLVEEALKALVVAFIRPEQTRVGDAVLWGMSAGAGFAIVETIFNASVSLTDWAPLILLRVGAAIVHVSNGALMGRGWYAARAERRWGRLFLAYAAAVVYHAAWNALTVVYSAGTVGLRNAPSWISPALTVVVLLGFLVLALLGLAWIVYVVRRSRPSVHPTPVAQAPVSESTV